MKKRLIRILPVLLTVCLLGVCFLFGGVQASDCEHSWSDWSGRDGQHRRECWLCGSVATGECEYYSIIMPPTCTEGGFTEKTCKLCNDSFITNETAASGHTWDDGTQTLVPTCVDEGTMLFHCLYCDAQKTESISATGEHNIVNDPPVAPTCIAPGKTLGAHCDVCGKVFIEQKTEEKLDHDWDTDNTIVVKEASCQPGLEKIVCKNCSTETEITLPVVADHKRFVQSIQKDPTCTTDGNTQHVICSVCEMVLAQGQPLPATGHNWAVTIHSNVTCTTDGLCDRFCNKCGTSEKDVVIPATGHAVQVSIPAKAATCTQSGYTAQVNCKNCFMELAASEPVAAIGHDYKLTSITQPTCTVDGSERYTCRRCNASYSEKIVKLSHDMYVASTTDPSCTEMGLILRRCTRCTHTLTQSIKALGHDEVYTEYPPTCTEGGYTKVSCTRCDFTGQINPTEPVGHDSEVILNIAPTCTEGGYEKHRCKVCAVEFDANHVDAKGHTWADGVPVAPTCTQEGYTKYDCLYCTQSKTDTPVPAAGHNLYEAESNGDGTHAGFCTVCETAVTQNCSGGTLSCLENAICAYCNGTYGNPSGEHSFTKHTAVDNSYHRLDCANCDTTGETTEKHSFVRGVFVPSAKGYAYSCRTCAHNVWGRPIGDADGNGSVGDAGDARAALRYSVGLDSPSEATVAAADVDRDGAVTAADARMILRVSVGLEEENWSVLFVTENGNLPN